MTVGAFSGGLGAFFFSFDLAMSVSSPCRLSLLLSSQRETFYSQGGGMSNGIGLGALAPYPECPLLSNLVLIFKKRKLGVMLGFARGCSILHGLFAPLAKMT